MSAAPRIVLVYANPAITSLPVPPYGMERIGQAFSLAGCEVELLAPFVEEDPVAVLAAALARPADLVGFSVRNIDDTLIVRSAEGDGPLDTTFYLDDVRPLVALAQAAVGPERVLAGGAAVGAGPEGVLAYLGLRWGITGPAEDLCWRIGRALARGEGLVLPDDVRIVRVGEPRPRPRGFGAAWKPPPGPTPRLGAYLGLTVARGSRVPVQLAHGCNRRCVFCVEARTTGHAVVQRDPEQVVGEVRALYDLGVRRFWLTTSELNVPDERHGIDVLRRLRPFRDADFRVYLQPAPFSEALLDAILDAGIDPTALNFEFGHFADAILKAGGGPANARHIDALAELFLRRGLRQLGGSVLLGAHWLETLDTIDVAVDRIRSLDAAFPDGLGLAYAAGGRLYPETGLADWVAAHRAEAAPHLYGEDDPSFVRPVVFCKPMAPRALLRHVRDAIGPTRGPVAPMNTETPSSADELHAEQLINRGLWRAQRDELEGAEAALVEATRRAPLLVDAWRQLALLRANLLGDADGAARALADLAAILGPDDPRRLEVDAALGALRG